MKTNKEWLDLLSKEFEVSRSTARDMLHALMALKKEDNFKRTLDPMEYKFDHCDFDGI